MKHYFLLLIITTNAASACPCEFSPGDTRPFFEQYENEIAPQPTDKKEEPCVIQ